MVYPKKMYIIANPFPETRAFSLQTMINILMPVFVIIVSAFSGQASNPPAKQKAADSSFQWGIRAVGTHHILLGALNKEWNSFQSAGIILDFPTTIPNLLLSGMIEAGVIDRKDRSITDLKIFLVSITLNYHFSWANHFALRPQIGVLNVTIPINASTNIASGAIFKNVENEFGAIIGCDLVFLYKKLQISLPLSFTGTFSVPEMLTLCNISLTAGVRF
jgi:hypothetical protein